MSVAPSLSVVPGGGSAASARDGQHAAAGGGAVLHAGGEFLADVAAFVEVDAVKFLEIAVEREERFGRDVGRCVGDAERQAVIVVGVVVRLCVVGALPVIARMPKRGEARVFEGDVAAAAAIRRRRGGPPSGR